MTLDLIAAFRAEWLKRKRGYATWLIVGAASFTPGIILLARLLRHASLAKLYESPTFWLDLWRTAWESMALMFLPLTAIVMVSLITQIEYRNNAWKQVHALPLRASTIYLAKFAVIALLLAGLLLAFNVAILIAGFAPCLLAGAPWPAAPWPGGYFLRESAAYFIEILPVLAVQYLICLRVAHFVAPLGVGLLAWIAAIGCASSRYVNALPHAYTITHFLSGEPRHYASVLAPVAHYALAAAWFALALALGFVLFQHKAQKG